MTTDLIKEKKSGVGAKALFLCFAIPILAMVGIYFSLKFWPFGEHAVIVLDLNAQYIYYFEELRQILTSGQSILYSFSRALGGEFMGIFAYYLSSPFSLLVALFPKEWMTEAIYTIIILKIGCCGLSFGYFISKTKKLAPVYTVMFSVMYALSSYAVVMQHNLMWMDNVIALPLLVLALDSLIKEGKYKLYVVMLVYSVFSNFYIGYMTCLFVLIWFFVRYFMFGEKERNPENKKNHFISALFRVGFWSIIAIMISAIIILPIYYSLSFGKLSFSDPNFTPKQMFNFLDILTKAFFGSYDSVRPAGMPFIYCGTLALVLAPLYFFSDKIEMRKKIGFAVILVVFAVGFNFNVADIVWHGMQRPNWLNARFAYMLVFIVLMMAAEVLTRLPEIGAKAVKASALVGCILLLICDKIGYDHIYTFRTVWCGILFFILIAATVPACIRAMKNPAGKKTAATVLCAIVIVEATANGVVMIYGLDDDVTFSTRKSYRTSVDDYTEATKIFEEDDTFFRAEKLVHRKKNDNFAIDINGLSNSTSTLNATTINLLSQFGYSAMSHWSMYSGATSVTDALFGIKYVMVEEDNSKPVMEYIHTLYEKIGSTDAGIDVYENPYALSIAYAVNDALALYGDTSPLPKADDYVDPFTYMNEVLSAMTGKKVVVWHKASSPELTVDNCKRVTTTNHKGYKPDASGKDSSISYTLTSESSMPLYVFFPSSWTREVEMSVNGDNLGKYLKDESYSIRELGQFEVGEEIEVKLKLKKDSLYIRSNTDFFYYYDEAAFVEAISTLKNGTMEAYSEKDDVITGNITVPADKNLIFTSIPYDEGWVITVDGIETELVPVLNNSLIAFRADPGQHEITMKYRPDCVKYGLIISAMGILTFLLSCLSDYAYERKQKKKAMLTVSAAEDDTDSGDDLLSESSDSTAESFDTEPMPTENTAPENTDTVSESTSDTDNSSEDENND